MTEASREPRRFADHHTDSAVGSSGSGIPSMDGNGESEGGFAEPGRGIREMATGERESAGATAEWPPSDWEAVERVMRAAEDYAAAYSHTSWATPIGGPMLRNALNEETNRRAALHRMVTALLNGRG